MKQTFTGNASDRRAIFTVAIAARLKFTAATPPANAPGDSPGAVPSIGTVSGYALVWNALSGDRGGYKVRLMPGSATFADQVLATYGHDDMAVLGSTSAKTLEIGQPDAVGVPVKIHLPDTQWGRDVACLMSRGDVAGMSFTMANGFEEYTESEEDGFSIVNCQKYTVDEVTICANPAFVQTTAQMDDDGDDDYAAREWAKIEMHRLNVLRLSM